MTVLQWMDIIYPFTAAGFVVYVACKLTWRVIVRRNFAALSPKMVRYVRHIVECDVFLGVTETAVLVVLGITTGEHPWLDINQFRFLVVLLRAMMGLSLLASNTVHILALREYWRVRIGDPSR